MRPQPYAAAQNAQLVNMFVEIVNAPCNSAGLGLQVSFISSVTMSSPFCPGHTIMPTVAFTSSGLGRRGVLCTLGDGVGCGVGARVGVLDFNRGLGHVVGGIFWSLHSGGTTNPVGTVASGCAGADPVLGTEPVLGVSGLRSMDSARQCRACSNWSDCYKHTFATHCAVCRIWLWPPSAASRDGARALTHGQASGHTPRP